MNKGHLLVTGGAGFIGSQFVRSALDQGYQVTVLDILSYAGHRENLQEPLRTGNCDLIEGSINDFPLVDSLFRKYQFTGLLNFAAETHVDNSIAGPRAFVETNVLGTFQLLEVIRQHWQTWNESRRKKFRFLHVSTDEVFGALGATGKFSETTAYAPNSPYSASKAGSDHLVRAWHHTYGLPTVITNCSNNYGPRQYPEKLIPLMIRHALKGLPLPVYGTGANVRDWIHVQDHCRGVLLALEKGVPGEVYVFGGAAERQNVEVVKAICHLLDELSPRQDGQKYETQIEFVKDRAGHDFRYAIDDEKARRELGFQRQFKSFEAGLRDTVQWYFENQNWVEIITAKTKKGRL